MHSPTPPQTVADQIRAGLERKHQSQREWHERCEMMLEFARQHCADETAIKERCANFAQSPTWGFDFFLKVLAERLEKEEPRVRRLLRLNGDARVFLGMLLAAYGAGYRGLWVRQEVIRQAMGCLCRRTVRRVLSRLAQLDIIRIGDVYEEAHPYRKDSGRVYLRMRAPNVYTLGEVGKAVLSHHAVGAWWGFANSPEEAEEGLPVLPRELSYIPEPPQRVEHVQPGTKRPWLGRYKEFFFYVRAEVARLAQRLRPVSRPSTLEGLDPVEVAAVLRAADRRHKQNVCGSLADRGAQLCFFEASGPPRVPTRPVLTLV